MAVVSKVYFYNRYIVPTCCWEGQEESTSNYRLTIR